MIDFPQDFFQAEVREDFLVDATMKSFWAAEIEVLREIAEICERYDLTWYAAYGTLLGAVRHEGFVPWDDDMDIWMKRADYKRFLEVAQDELPQGYLVHSPMTDLGYLQFHSCVLNADSVSVEERRLREFHGCPFVVGVDVYPLDVLPDDEERHQKEREIFDVISTTCTLINKGESSPKNLKNVADNVKWLKELLGRYNACVKMSDYSVLTGGNLKQALSVRQGQERVISALYHMANCIVGNHDSAEGGRLVMYMDYINWEQKVYLAEWFEEIEIFPFEGLGIPVPAYYDDILQRIYGDYHIRVRGSMHGYPMYQKQLEQMREMIRKLEERQ